MQGPVIELDGVSRRFGELVAVAGASVRLEPGVLHAIVGENGAGKSTLLKIAAGLLAPSAGKVMIEGRPLEPATAAAAIARGVGMVHQHFMLVGAFTALENVVLGAEPRDSWGRLDLARAATEARDLMERSGLRVPLASRADALTVGERQRLEILRVLYRGARAILLDEPTAVLSPLEAGELYGTLRKLADGGATIAVVTHRLDEVVRFAERVTVMRRGRVVHARALGAADRSGRAVEDELTRAIMGGEPPPPFAPPPVGDDAPPVLEIEGLRLAKDGVALLSGIELSVRAGEIVGVAGVEGNGQRELARSLGGLEPDAVGRIAIAGAELALASPRARRPYLGIVYEDRHAEGLLLEATVADNLVLGDLGDPRGGALDERAVVARRLERYDVRPREPARLAAELSGGNQQKLVVARAIDRLLASKARGALVLAQPTRGVDVGAASTIHAAIGEAAKAGLAVLVISADLEELRRVSHRLVVMHRGTIVATLPPDVSDDVIGRAMLGVEAA